MVRARFGIPLFVAALFVVAVAPSRVSGATPCSLPSLNGTYGVKFDGHSQALGRFASVSLWRFDGSGNLTASESFNSDQTGPQTRAVDGKYEMRRNCKFRLLFPSELAQSHEAVGDCVLVDDGNEFYCIDVEEGWVATGIGKKVNTPQ